MFDLDAGAAAGGDGGLDGNLVTVAGRYAENRAGLDDRMTEEIIGLEIVELGHADGALHQISGRGVEHGEIARIEHDAGGVAVAPFDAEGADIAEHSAVIAAPCGARRPGGRLRR